MPTAPDATPAVVFRQRAHGMKTPLTMQAGLFHAAKWQGYAGRDCWTWEPGSAEGMDIVGYYDPDCLSP